MESPATTKRKAAATAEYTKTVTEVGTWMKGILGRDVKIPDDLQDGVAICELLNKQVPGIIEKFEAQPKNVFAKAENFMRVNEALIKCGISAADLPEPMSAANGNSTKRIVNLLHTLSIRAAKLRAAPASYVAKSSTKLNKISALTSAQREYRAKTMKAKLLGSIRAAAYQRQYAAERAAIVNHHKQANKPGHFFVPAEPRVAFVMRLRGINGVPPKVKTILKLLRLRQIHNAVFLKLNKATLAMLKAVEAYVAIGYPSIRSIRLLICKRGYAKIRHQRIKLTSNALVSASLGKLGVHTVDDIVHQIATCGPLFAECNRFLWPFKMTSPRGGFGARGKLRHYVEGGAAGNRQGKINSLIRQCI